MYLTVRMRHIVSSDYMHFYRVRGDCNKYLQDKGSQLLVEDNVEPKNFEASASKDMVGKARAIVVLENSMRRDQRLDDDIINLLPESFDVIVIVVQPFVNGRYSPETIKA